MIVSFYSRLKKNSAFLFGAIDIVEKKRAVHCDDQILLIETSQYLQLSQNTVRQLIIH